MSTDLYVPIRCYSCNKVLGHLQRPYEEELRQGHKTPGQVLDDLGIKRECCRMNMLRPAVILVPEENVPGTIGEYAILTERITRLSTDAVPSLPSGGALSAITSSEPISSAGGDKIHSQIFSQRVMSEAPRSFEERPGFSGLRSEVPVLPMAPSVQRISVSSIPMSASRAPSRLTQQPAPITQAQLPPRPVQSRQELPSGGVITPIPTLENLGIL